VGIVVKKSNASVIRASKKTGLLFLLLSVCVLTSCTQGTQKAPAPTNSQNSSTAPTLKHYDIKVADLPSPEVQQGPQNFSKIISRPLGAELARPAGFSISEYAADLKKPRWMQIAPNGDVFVAESEEGQISI